MKVGFSYSSCVRDIVDGRVKLDDVLVIICGTDFDPTDDAHWQEIWQGYTKRLAWGDVNPESEPLYKKVTLELYLSGRLHQPRQDSHGNAARLVSQTWVELGPIDPSSLNQSTRMAWEHYQTLAKLTQEEQHVI